MCVSWTNAECLSAAHNERCAVSDDILNARGFTKVALFTQDSAKSNPRHIKEVLKTHLLDFFGILKSCTLHNTALVKLRATLHIADDLITGQINWTLTINRGATTEMYRECIHEIATEWIEIASGYLDYAKLKRQRHIMRLIFMPHSFVFS